MFGCNPQEALGGIVGPAVSILDAAESVEGVRQRYSQGPLDQQPRPARQPIMRVEDLRRVRAEPGLDRLGEGPHVSRERGGRHRVGRSGVDVDHPVARHDIDDLGIVRDRRGG